jgi:hypothetical protein
LYVVATSGRSAQSFELQNVLRQPGQIVNNTPHEGQSASGAAGWRAISNFRSSPFVSFWCIWRIWIATLGRPIRGDQKKWSRR